MGLKRGAGRHLYTAGRGHLDVRAKARTARRGIGARSDSGRVLVRPELGDGPDMWRGFVPWKEIGKEGGGEELGLLG